MGHGRSRLCRRFWLRFVHVHVLNPQPAARYFRANGVLPSPSYWMGIYRESANERFAMVDGTTLRQVTGWSSWCSRRSQACRHAQARPKQHNLVPCRSPATCPMRTGHGSFSTRPWWRTTTVWLALPPTHTTTGSATPLSARSRATAATTRPPTRRTTSTAGASPHTLPRGFFRCSWAHQGANTSPIADSS